MRARICKTFRFEAAHVLPNHAGKCSRLHGHSYRVDIEAYGEVRDADGSSSEGMVMDFGDIKAAWKPIEAELDHQNLTSLLPFPTTAENLAGYLLDRLADAVPRICAVRVWETTSAWAEARG